MFKLVQKSRKSKARLSTLTTPHGKIRGPFFMPIATRGAVKFLDTNEVKDLGAQIVLSNTYHLFIRPGIKNLKKYKGLHAFMNWDGPILTDSGGYQVFSLSKSRKITATGVHFRDPIGGHKLFLSPKKAIEIQDAIGSDIAMVLDECPSYPCTTKYAHESLLLTTKWAKTCKDHHDKIHSKKTKSTKPLLFGIVQGSIYDDLRVQSARELREIGFDGYAIGGVAVGEPREVLNDVLKWTVPELPENKPRYLMGLGRPEEIVSAVQQGIDMFDCVIPTREARHGRLYIRNKEKGIRNKGHGKNFYKTINITNAKFANDLSPVNNTNLQQYSKAYLHHLFKTSEPLGQRLATLNNLEFYLSLMRSVQSAIRKGLL